MGVFARLAQLIKANLNDLISRAEDPEKMLNQIIYEMNGQLINAKKQVAVAIADEKHLAKQAEQEAANAAEWERRAMLAIRQGDDTLAKEALQRKKEHDDLYKQYEEQWKKQKGSVDQLKTALRVLNDKIEEAKRKKNLIIARTSRAKAQQAIQQTMMGLKDESAFDALKRIEAKVERMETESEAQLEMAQEANGDRLEQKFKNLENVSGVDDDLLEMKRKMGLAPAAPEPVITPPMRVKAPVTPLATPSGEELETDELQRALEELQAEKEREQERLKRLSRAGLAPRSATPEVGQKFVLRAGWRKLSGPFARMQESSAREGAPRGARGVKDPGASPRCVAQSAPRRHRAGAPGQGGSPCATLESLSVSPSPPPWAASSPTARCRLAPRRSARLGRTICRKRCASLRQGRSITSPPAPSHKRRARRHPRSR